MSEICFILVGFTALVGACLVLDRAKNLQDVKIWLANHHYLEFSILQVPTLLQVQLLHYKNIFLYSEV